jgi:methylaspartate mutase S subunit
MASAPMTPRARQRGTATGEETTGGETTGDETRGRHTHRVVLGGIGPDCHSVGLSILRVALRSSGYDVSYLATHNELEDFFREAGSADAVLMSSLDGHALQYVREFPGLRLKYGGPSRALWYIGGNLCIGREADEAAAFLELGFDRAFVKFVDVTEVLSVLREDLLRTDQRASETGRQDEPRAASPPAGLAGRRADTSGRAR